jgi:glycosyltransferase involved in cell wall biosynthesis/GT2 family glycosyltransferase
MVNEELALHRSVQNWLEGFSPEAPVVVVPVFNAYDDVIECIDSLLATTPQDTPILILDDASTDERIASTLEPLSRRRGFAYVRKSANSGFVNSANLAFEWCVPHDVVLVNSDVIVPPEWLERLRVAAYHRSTIATATPLTNHGTIVSVPYRNKPVPNLVEGMTTVQADARIREASFKLRPIIPAAVGHCIYFKRAALDTVGCFDQVFSPGYGEEVDFSQRAVAAGFSHVVADDLFVFHKGSRSFRAQGQEARQSLQTSHEQIIGTRYPWYHHWVNSVKGDLQSPLALAIERARGALLGYRVAIDATCVGGSTTGTQVLTLELIRALATAPSRCKHLAMIVHDWVPQEALLGVDQLVDEVIHLPDLEDQEQPLFDLIHRPFQIQSAEDLTFLHKAANRFIVSQLDCIFYANPSYAADPETWMQYWRLTRLALASSDGIAFISQDAAQDAAHHGLQIPDSRQCITYVGVDHLLHSAAAAPPAESNDFEDQPFILMLGTNFKHKNRVYALRLFKALIKKHRWDGQLVFAGPEVSWGGSDEEEEIEIWRSPELQSRVHRLKAVNEAEKRWLLEKAALVLYPSNREGFGLVPFEAAAVGTPVLTTRAASLGEVLGDQVIYLDTNPKTGAEAAWLLLSDPKIARGQVEAIRAKSADFTWEGVADRTWDFYRQILDMPPRSPELARLWEHIERLQEGPKTWRERVAVALTILLTKGFRPLWREMQQYIQWRLSQS